MCQYGEVGQPRDAQAQQVRARVRRDDGEANELRVWVLLGRAGLEAIVLEDHCKRHVAEVAELPIAACPQEHDGIDLGKRHAAAKGGVVARRLEEELMRARALPRLE